MTEKKQIACRYDASAEVYDARYTDIQHQKYSEILSRVMVFENNWIIDIGCGTGLFLGLLTNIMNESFFKPIVGIDLSYEMIKIAHTKFPEIDFIVADSDNLPFKENSFDRIFSVTHLQNLPAPITTINEMNRIAQRKALVAISILRKTWTQDKLREIVGENNFVVEDEWIARVEDIGVLCNKP
ncbi:MAG: class I SAM-dependent methyltransferase [Candidatus Heimdallarchaeota archaeon]|nr:class I SAM-dependent methyltransferase [Candidatus Heimdallarchaeota archaeon]